MPLLMQAIVKNRPALLLRESFSKGNVCFSHCADQGAGEQFANPLPAVPSSWLVYFAG
jgi:hypothetical protein